MLKYKTYISSKDHEFWKKSMLWQEKNDVIVAIKNMSSIHFNGFIKGVNEYMDNNNILFKIK